MIRQNEVEKKSYPVWINNRIKGERHSLTMTLEAFTDKMKDAFHECNILGYDLEMDERALLLMDAFFDFEQFAYSHIENSTMARDSLNKRMEFELAHPETANSERHVHGRRVL